MNVSNTTQIINCNNGFPTPPLNVSCTCNDGWTTSEQQTINIVWCNQTLYDSEYFGESYTIRNVCSMFI